MHIEKCLRTNIKMPDKKKSAAETVADFFKLKNFKMRLIFLLVFLFELINSSGSVNELHFTSEKWVRSI